MFKNKWASFSIVFLLALTAGCLCYPKYLNQGIDFLNSTYSWNLSKVDEEFKLGLDLKGGVHLEYEADLSETAEDERASVMEGLKDVIERRVNIFGVSEPQILISGENRLVVELPGVESIQEAIEWIGETPWLEFYEEREEEETQKILDKIEELYQTDPENYAQVEDWQIAFEHPYYKSTQLTGRYLEKATLQFDQTTYAPVIQLKFSEEGKEIFEDITERNVGKSLAIFLDGKSIIDTDGDGEITDLDLYAPTITEKISSDTAVITGEKNVDEAKLLVQRLNQGALPVSLSDPIVQKKIGPTLGQVSFSHAMQAGIAGLIAIITFLILIYRFPGLIASLALIVYCALVFALIKIIPVTLTLPGLGGIILSVGMAVDANVLIFSRMREEIKEGRSVSVAISEGFKRAWPSIRDGNLTTLIVAIILYQFGSSFIKSFAFTLILGILISLFSAMIITKVFLQIFENTKIAKIKWFWK